MPCPAGAGRESVIGCDITHAEKEHGSGPAGSGAYTVQPGDCLSSIAHRHGPAWQKIWNAATRDALVREHGSQRADDSGTRSNRQWRMKNGGTARPAWR